MAVDASRRSHGPWLLLLLWMVFWTFKVERVGGHGFGGVFASRRLDHIRQGRFLISDEKLDPTVSNDGLKNFPWETLNKHLNNLADLSKSESGTLEQSQDGVSSVSDTSSIGEPTNDTEEETTSKKRLSVRTEALRQDIKSLQAETRSWSALGEVVKAHLTSIHGYLPGGETEDKTLVTKENLEKSAPLKKESAELIEKKGVLARTSHDLSDFFKAGKGWGGGGEVPYPGCSKAGNGQLYSGPPSLQLDWNPTPGKYLLAICPMGQMSNRIMCFQIYMGMAALINRTLVVPMKDLGSHTNYDFSTVFDIPHARKCAGEATVLTDTEYMERERKEMIKVKVHCLWPGSFKVGPCGYRKGRRQVQIRDPQIEVLGRNEAGVISSNPTLSEFLAAYGNLRDPVVRHSFGDLLYIGYKHLSFLKQRPNGPVKILDPSCKLVIQATGSLQEIANRIIRDKIGTRYMGIHLRRGDFLSFCEHKVYSCFKPLSQIAACIAAKVNSLGTEIDKIYFAHNAEGKEILYLQKAILAQTKRRYSTLELKDVLDLDVPSGLRKLLKKPETIAALDKIIVSRSRVFLGTVHSTFSVDISRLRGGLGTASCLDGNVCDEDATDVNKGYKEFRTIVTETEGVYNQPFKGAKHGKRG